MPLKVNCILECDSCGQKKQLLAPYTSTLGFFEVGEKWVTHSHTTFVQCRPCFEETDKKYKESKKKIPWIKRFLAGGRWWYSFAPGHWAYKEK